MAKKINVTLAQFKAGITRKAESLRKHGILDKPGTFKLYSPGKAGNPTGKGSRGNFGLKSRKRMSGEEKRISLSSLEAFVGADD